MNIDWQFNDSCQVMSGDTQIRGGIILTSSACDIGRGEKSECLVEANVFEIGRKTKEIDSSLISEFVCW